MQSRIDMYTAIDEEGARVRVARIVPRFRVIRLDRPGIVEGPPQWLTDAGERLNQLSDTQLQVVRTRRRLEMVQVDAQPGGGIPPAAASASSAADMD